MTGETRVLKPTGLLWRVQCAPSGHRLSRAFSEGASALPTDQNPQEQQGATSLPSRQEGGAAPRASGDLGPFSRPLHCPPLLGLSTVAEGGRGDSPGRGEVPWAEPCTRPTTRRRAGRALDNEGPEPIAEGPSPLRGGRSVLPSGLCLAPSVAPHGRCQGCSCGPCRQSRLVSFWGWGWVWSVGRRGCPWGEPCPAPACAVVLPQGEGAPRVCHALQGAPRQCPCAASGRVQPAPSVVILVEAPG